MDLIENEGMSKEGQLVIDKIYEHVEEQMDEVSLTFIIWFNPNKKEGAESPIFSIGYTSSVSRKNNFAFESFVIAFSSAKKSMVGKKQKTETKSKKMKLKAKN